MFLNQIQQALQSLEHADYFDKNKPLVVSWSGGVDSTVLLHACSQRGLNVYAVHVNHGLQSAAVDFEKHCQQLAEQLNIKLTVLYLPKKNSAGSLETWAREQRYLAIYNWMLTQGFTQLALGHHINDQAETILLQLLRGSGFRGVGGMACVSSPSLNNQEFQYIQVFRPLLALKKEDLENYVQQFNLTCIEDPSNKETTIRRNWVRHNVLPSVVEQFPQAEASLLKLGQFIQAHHHTVDDMAADLLRTISNNHVLSLEKFKQLSHAGQTEVLRLWLKHSKIRCGRDKLLELQRQLQLPKGGRRQVASGWVVEVKKNFAMIKLEHN